MALFDLIIFDCDGTLVDSEQVNNQATIDTLAAEGFPAYTLEHAYSHWMGKALSKIIPMVEGETGRAARPDFAARYTARVSELQALGLKPVEGAGAVIEAAQDMSKICVASNGERQNVLNSLQVTGLLPYFGEDHVFTKIQVSNPKPAPDLFLFAAEKLNVPPARCLVIEDSTSGVAAGVAAGMTTWGFTGVAHRPDLAETALRTAGAQQVFSRLIHIAANLAP